MEITTKNIISALNEFDYDRVEALSNEILTTPIESFANTCLYILLQCDDEETFPYMIDVLQNVNPYKELHIVNIVTTWTSNRQVVEYTRKYLSDTLTHLELIDQWITYPGAYFDNIGIACGIYISVYGPIGESVMKTMLEETHNANKYDFYNVLFGLYSRSSNYAPIPSWIAERTTTDRELQSKMELLGKHVLDDLTLSKQLYNELNQYIDEDREQLLSIIEGLGDNDKETLTSLVLSDNDNLTSFFGPSNPFPPSLHDPIQERMLLCNVYSPHVDDDDDDDDWFDGSCDECGSRIREAHHCLRMPQVTGGWLGCFCSWKCLQDRADDDIQDLIVKIKDEIEKKLIYDR